MDSHPLKRQQSGFSLIEIALTIGIIGITIVPIIGILSVSSRANFKSDTLAIGASIAGDLFSQAQQASFEQVNRWETNPPDFYFDNEGLALPDQESDKASFTARLVIQPTELDSGAVNEFMKRVTVWISAFPGESSDRIDEALMEIDSDPDTSLPTSIRTFQSLITQLDKVE